MEVYNSSYTAAELEYALGAVPSIGDNGNWYIGDTDTGVFAGGVDVSGAEVGQIIKVAEVDENGRPTAWEAADSIGGWRFFQRIEVTEEIQYFYITETPNGEPFTCNDLLLKVKAVNRNGADLSSFKVAINPPMPNYPTTNMIIAIQKNEFGNKTSDRYYVFTAEFGEFGLKSWCVDHYAANIFQTTAAHAVSNEVYKHGVTYSALQHEDINALLILAANNFMVGDIIEIYVK